MANHYLIGNGVIVSTGDKPLSEFTEAELRDFYEGTFQQAWLMSHKHTLGDIFRRLDRETEEFGAEPPCPSVLFKIWEYEDGFGGEIWPCFDEFCDCDLQALIGQEKVRKIRPRWLRQRLISLMSLI